MDSLIHPHATNWTRTFPVSADTTQGVGESGSTSTSVRYPALAVKARSRWPFGYPGRSFERSQGPAPGAPSSGAPGPSAQSTRASSGRVFFPSASAVIACRASSNGMGFFSAVLFLFRLRPILVQPQSWKAMAARVKVAAESDEEAPDGVIFEVLVGSMLFDRGLCFKDLTCRGRSSIF